MKNDDLKGRSGKSPNIYSMVYIALGTALIAVCSWITVPTVVPFTMQLFAVFLILELFGGKQGTFSVVIYVLLGIIGIPVFAGFSSGFGAILSPHGGFIIGFLILSLIGWGMEKVPIKFRYKSIVSMILGLLACYLCGTVWFMIIYGTNEEAISFLFAVSTCVAPFVVPDIMKIILAYALAKKIRSHIK